MFLLLGIVEGTFMTKDNQQWAQNHGSTIFPTSTCEPVFRALRHLYCLSYGIGGSTGSCGIGGGGTLLFKFLGFGVVSDWNQHCWCIFIWCGSYYLENNYLRLYCRHLPYFSYLRFNAFFDLPGIGFVLLMNGHAQCFYIPRLGSLIEFVMVRVIWDRVQARVCIGGYPQAVRVIYVGGLVNLAAGNLEQRK